MIEKKPLITHMYTADPSAHVFEGKLYIYPSHDKDQEIEENDNGDQYDMEDYHVFEMSDPSSLPVDKGMIFHLKDVPWASQQLWAPDAAFKNGEYYFYFPARDKEGIFRIGVAKSKKPYGPFKPEPKFIEGSFSIDPCVFEDDDGAFYMGFGGLWGGQLEKWQTGNFDPNAKESVGTEPAFCPKLVKLSDSMTAFAEAPKNLVIVDQFGKPLTGGDHDRRYFEGPWIHKYRGTYYFSYSTGNTHHLCYATSNNIYGPYTYRGELLTPVLGWTTHHSIVEWSGNWYLFYHDCELSKGTSHKRNVKFQKLTYNPDGSIVTMNP